MHDIHTQTHTTFKNTHTHLHSHAHAHAYTHTHRLQGPLPVAITNLRLVQRLDASNNELIGELDPDLFAKLNSLVRARSRKGLANTHIGRRVHALGNAVGMAKPQNIFVRTEIALL